MGWTFDHFDSHFPWKQFNQLTEREQRKPTGMGSGGSSESARAITGGLAYTQPSRSVNWLLLVRSDGQPVYEQREQ